MFSDTSGKEPQGGVLSRLGRSQVLSFLICKMGKRNRKLGAPKAIESMKGKFSGISL